MKVLVTGGRNMLDRGLVELRLKEYPNCEFITGSAEGTECYVRDYCDRNKLKCSIIDNSTDWVKSAEIMIKSCDRALVFFDNNSTGTAYILNRLFEDKKVTELVNY